MIVTTIACAALLYGFGLVRAEYRGISLHTRAIVAFALGLLLSGLVLIGPMDDLADGSLAWHMVQHLTLSFVVAPLFLLGAPVRLVLAALPARAASIVARALRSRSVRVLSQPAFAWVQFIAVLYVVHFSPLYEAALENATIHMFEHTLFLVSALVFWMPILAVSPAPHAPSHPVRLLMLFVALPTSGFLGFIFYVARVPLYAHYAAHVEALGDQANAGAVMWIAGGASLFVALLACVADWGARERRLGALADRIETSA